MIEQSIEVTSAVRNRVARGIGDVGRVTAHGTYYGVRSSSHADVVHMVTLTHPELGEVCRCEDWQEFYHQYQVSRPCRHIYAATLYEARNCRRGPKVLH